jgi:sugar O-acyltransferase (sialic acid O-acetyltransferase NeuD family)
MKNLIIVSAGRFGREVYALAMQALTKDRDWNIKGFLDDRKNILERYSYNIPILASAEEYKPDQDDLFICAIGDVNSKIKYSHIIEDKGGKFATLIHPSAIIGPNISIGEGSIICANVYLSCDIEIGKHVVLNALSSVGHDVSIGDYSQISSNCAINGNVIIGSKAFIGSGATIIPRIVIDSDAFIGAGSVVIRRVKKGHKVFGNPAIEM